MIVEVAPAKINLALHVRRRRADGYHDLETLFAFAQDGDAVRVAAGEADSFAIDGPFASALGGGGGADNASDNLVLRARDAFRAAFPAPPVAVALTKNLPVASGIGGGSADAAATLRALARLSEIAPDHPRLDAIARGLGADVPVCLHGRTAFGTGRGDDLEPIDGLTDTPLLLVNPRVPVSTAAAFAGWDGVDRGPIARGGALLDRARRGGNDLTRGAIERAPVIAALLAQLGAAPGATFARMSGSGATCFALFADTATRDAAAAAAAVRGWWTLATKLA